MVYRKLKQLLKPTYRVPAPESVVIGVTNICNFRCEMCHVWKNKEVKEISINKIFKIIDEITKFNSKDLLLQFHGGETLMYKDLGKAISYATSKGVKTGIVTNGYFLNKKKILELSNAGLFSLNISLDSTKQDVHNFLRGNEKSYQRIMEALDILEVSKGDMIVGINSIISSLNINKVLDMCKFVKERDFLSNVYFLAMDKPYESSFNDSWQYKGRASYLWPKDSVLINKAFDSLIKERKENSKVYNSISQLEKYRSYYLNPEDFIKNKGCKFGYEQIQINYSGQIRLCTIRPDLESVGSINDNIIEIWNSKKSKEIRKQMKSCRQNCILILSCGYKDEEK